MGFIILFALFIVVLISISNNQKEVKKYLDNPIKANSKFYNFYKNGLEEEVLVMSFFPLEHTNYFWYGMKRIKERINNDGVFNDIKKDPPEFPFEIKPGYTDLVTSWKNEKNEEFFIIFVVPISYVSYFEKVYEEEFVGKKNEVIIEKVIEEKSIDEEFFERKVVKEIAKEEVVIEEPSEEEPEEDVVVEENINTEEECKDFVLVTDQPEQSEESNQDLWDLEDMVHNCDNDSDRSDIDSLPLSTPEITTLSEEEMAMFVAATEEEPSSSESEEPTTDEMVFDEEISEVFENDVVENVIDLTPENQEDTTEEVPEELPDEIFEEPILSQEEEKKPSTEEVFEELVLKQEEQEPSTELFKETVLQQEEDLLQMIPESMRPIELVKKPIKVLIMKIFHDSVIGQFGKFEFGDEFEMNIFENKSLPMLLLNLKQVILSSDNEAETKNFMNYASKNREIYLFAGLNESSFIKSCENKKIGYPMKLGERIIIFNHKKRTIPGLEVGIYAVGISPLE